VPKTRWRTERKVIRRKIRGVAQRRVTGATTDFGNPIQLCGVARTIPVSGGDQCSSRGPVFRSSTQRRSLRGRCSRVVDRRTLPAAVVAVVGVVEAEEAGGGGVG